MPSPCCTVTRNILVDCLPSICDRVEACCYKRTNIRLYLVGNILGVLGIIIPTAVIINDLEYGLVPELTSNCCNETSFTANPIEYWRCKDAASAIVNDLNAGYLSVYNMSILLLVSSLLFIILMCVLYYPCGCKCNYFIVRAVVSLFTLRALLLVSMCSAAILCSRADAVHRIDTSHVTDCDAFDPGRRSSMLNGAIITVIFALYTYIVSGASIRSAHENFLERIGAKEKNENGLLPWRKVVMKDVVKEEANVIVLDASDSEGDEG